MASNKYVSRGGDKLQFAIDNFQLSIKDKVCLDVGSSTGGFVDCLLSFGATKVYSVDTAYGELAWKLRNDPRVVVMERVNILHLESLPENVDLITIDAGWTKLEFTLPAVKKFLKRNGIIIALLKPQYEADKKILKAGVVPEETVLTVKNQVLRRIKELGFKVIAEIKSPILGAGGNREYLVYLKSGL